jgi:hypothetical protein
VSKGRYSYRSPDGVDVVSLPDDLEKKLRGPEEDDDDLEDESTGVTKMFDEMRQCSSVTRASLKRATSAAMRVSMLTRSDKFRPPLKKALLSTPPSPEEGKE